MMPDKSETTPAKTGVKESRAVSEHAWDPIWNLRDEIDELFEDFYPGARLGPFRRRWNWPRHRSATAFSWRLPTIDVIDKDDEVEISAELPGMAEEDIDVRVTDSTLTVSGEKKQEREEGDKGGEHYLAERRYGSFRRTIAIPEGVDQNRIEAGFRNGVLTVHLPKRPEARKPSKKIEVRAES